jgi:hypothetical protein
MLQITTNGGFDPQSDIYSIDQLQLEGISLFVNLLHKKKLFKKIGLGDKKSQECCDTVTEKLEYLGQKDRKWNPFQRLRNIKDNSPGLYEEIKKDVVQGCANAYVSGNREKRENDFISSWEKNESVIIETWDAVVSHFEDKDLNGNRRVNLASLVKDIIKKGRKVIVDLDPSRLRTEDEGSGMDESLKLFIMEFVFRKIRHASHMLFKSDDDKANCLIVLDEAGRFIPQSPGENADLARIGKYIEDKVRELRKFGVGFQFITQNLTEIKKDVFRNLHYRIYGVGMSVGVEANHIVDKEGKQNFDTYSSLPDPKLSGIYSFMVCGSLIAMGTTGKPMYIEGFDSDDEVLRENGHPITGEWGELESQMSHATKESNDSEGIFAED